MYSRSVTISGFLLDDRWALEFGHRVRAHIDFGVFSHYELAMGLGMLRREMSMTSY